MRINAIFRALMDFFATGWSFALKNGKLHHGRRTVVAHLVKIIEALDQGKAKPVATKNDGQRLLTDPCS